MRTVLLGTVRFSAVCLDALVSSGSSSDRGAVPPRVARQRRPRRPEHGLLERGHASAPRRQARDRRGAALKPLRSAARRFLVLETPSSTDVALGLPHLPFTPSVFVGIGPYLERKVEILYERFWVRQGAPFRP